MYRRLFVASFYLLVLAAIPACSEQELKNPPTLEFPVPVEPLRIGISDSAGQMEDSIRSAYQLVPGRADLIFFNGNDRTLLEELESGLLDAVIIYELPDTEKFVEAIAVDALVFIAHPDIHLRNIGLQTLRTLYKGTVTRWSTFGQADFDVTLLVREAGSGPETIFSSKVISSSEISPNSLIAVSESDMASTILKTPGGLGYGLAGSLAEFSTLTIDGKFAKPESIETKEYPLIAHVNFVSLETPTGDLELLLAGLLSVNGQNLIGENYGRVR